MLILSFDTSAARLPIVLAEEEKVLASAVYGGSGTHMKNILPAIRDILAEAGKTVKDLEAVAAVCGPGSFTGIRIGAATAQGLAAASGIPCIKLNSLEAAAYGKCAPGRITVPMLEARNRRVYAAAYRGQELLISPAVGRVEDLAALIAGKREDESILFCGDETAARYADDEEVLKHLGVKAEAADESGYKAEVLAALAAAAWREGRLLKPEELLPDYYAPTQAERNFGMAEEKGFGA